MRILSAVQAILAIAFIVFGFVALFGIGIAGLLLLVPGALFAGTAAIAQEQSRAGAIVALAADAVLAYMAARKLGAIFSSGTADIALHRTVRALAHPSLVDYLAPFAVLILGGTGALAVAIDWRTLRNARWFQSLFSAYRLRLMSANGMDVHSSAPFPQQHF